MVVRALARLTLGAEMPRLPSLIRAADAKRDSRETERRTGERDRQSLLERHLAESPPFRGPQYFARFPPQSA